MIRFINLFNYNFVSIVLMLLLRPFICCLIELLAFPMQTAFGQKLQKMVLITLMNYNQNFQKFYGDSVKTVIVELVFMLGQRWHLEDLQKNVFTVKISFGKKQTWGYRK